MLFNFQNVIAADSIWKLSLTICTCLLSRIQTLVLGVWSRKIDNYFECFKIPFLAMSKLRLSLIFSYLKCFLFVSIFTLLKFFKRRQHFLCQYCLGQTPKNKVCILETRQVHAVKLCLWIKSAVLTFMIGNGGGAERETTLWSTPAGMLSATWLVSVVESFS